MVDFVSMPAPLPTQTLADVERAYIAKVLEAVNGNKAKACAILGMNESTLWRKLKKDRKLQQASIAAYQKKKVEPSKLLYASRKPAAKPTPKSKQPMTAERKAEIGRYIEDIYDSLKNPS